MKRFEKDQVFNFGSVIITCEEVVKLPGVDIDFNLSFDLQLSNIYKKAAHQLNGMRQFCHNLSLLNKLTVIYTFDLPNFIFLPFAMAFLQPNRY